MFGRRAMTVPTTRTCVTGTCRTNLRESGPRVGETILGGATRQLPDQRNRHALSDRLQELRPRRARSVQAVDRSARQEWIGQDQSDRGCRASRHPGPAVRRSTKSPMSIAEESSRCEVACDHAFVSARESSDCDSIEPSFVSTEKTVLSTTPSKLLPRGRNDVQLSAERLQIGDRILFEATKFRWGADGGQIRQLFARQESELSGFGVPIRPLTLRRNHQEQSGEQPQVASVNRNGPEREGST